MQRVNESSQRNTVKDLRPVQKIKVTSYFDTWPAYVQSTFEQQRPHPSCHDCFENRSVWAKCAVHNQLDAICATMCTQRPVGRSACNYRLCPIQRDEKQSSDMCCQSMFNQTSCNENCIPSSPVAAKSYLNNFASYSRRFVVKTAVTKPLCQASGTSTCCRTQLHNQTTRVQAGVS